MLYQVLNPLTSIKEELEDLCLPPTALPDWTTGSHFNLVTYKPHFVHALGVFMGVINISHK